MVFLLGGRDLEMCAIKRILKKHGVKFIDKNLEWGAKISAYKSELEQFKNQTIYAVELENDLNIKNGNVVFIDHHNDNSDKPSSIEQVAVILNHKLSRFEYAVALNDKAYIKALMNEGFGMADIERIRRLDRLCQGVSEQEEEASKSVELKRIIYFNYERFSPLCDRIFFEKPWMEFIVYNDRLAMFYGFDVEDLQNYLEKIGIKADFWGGGERGFLGVNKKIDKNVLKRVLMAVGRPVSTHTFMFPFVIKDYDKFRDALNKCEFGEWREAKTELNSAGLYNEFSYFYPHIRKVLFPRTGENSLSETKELIAEEGSVYKIKIKMKKEENEFSLILEKLTLYVFDKSIGILSFHLKNYEYNENEILKINDFGRRIYPQFLKKNNDFVEAAKDAFLADRIELKINGHTVVEDFSNFKSLDGEIAKLDRVESKMIPSFIKKIVGDAVLPIIDDRMFVVSFHLDEKKRVLNRLMKFDSGEYGYVDDDWWYKFLFVDGKDKSCANRVFCKEVVKESTYDRWIDWGTLWGITRYSFVGISSADFIMEHANSMYFDMVILLLSYKAYLVYLNTQVQKMVQLISEKESFDNISEEAKGIYEKYLSFLNGIYFKEITPQDQGIEIYRKAFAVMGIEGLLKDFDREIEELNNYINFRVESKRNMELDSLNKLGYLLLPPSLIAGILGMNVGNFDKCNNFLGIVLGIFALVLSFVAGFLGLKQGKYTKLSGLILFLISFAIVILLSFGCFYFSG
ncbi:hypothetical protein [Hippea sp. KM1]|uniref:hypothetical protein n=1 Tax=Hippea sp. KM1 TaxID=944481 RepID=UPI0012EC9721|nr:hypothetical protein [Hippea sp. KM1]